MLSLSSHTATSSAIRSNERETDWLPLRDAVSEFSLHPNTLRKYADAGRVKILRLPSGKRLWSKKSLLAMTQDSRIRAGE